MAAAFGNQTVEPSVRGKAFPFFWECVIRAGHAGDATGLMLQKMQSPQLPFLASYLLTTFGFLMRLQLHVVPAFDPQNVNDSAAGVVHPVI